MSEEVWEDLNAFRMSRADAYGVLARALGCTVCWTRRDGHPLAVYVYHALIDGELHVTTTDNRPKTMAWKRDPRTSLVVSEPGTGCVTVVGRVELSDDRAFLRRFLAALCDKMKLAGPARSAWIAHMDSDGRFTARVVVEKLITFDERKISF